MNATQNVKNDTSKSAPDFPCAVLYKEVSGVGGPTDPSFGTWWEGE